MITEDYVSFEVAKLLKEKGFNEGCNSYFISDNEIALISNRRDFNGHGIYLSAPTIQMAMKWLREYKHMIIVVQPEYFNGGIECSYWGVDVWADDNYEKLQGDFPSYTQACEAAIKYCLENYI